jgi:hypothetical protein
MKERSVMRHGRSAGAHDETEDLSRSAWAWAFLRRNPAFQRQLEHLSAHVSYDRIGPNVMIFRLGNDDRSLKHWGLIFRDCRKQSRR